MKACDALLDNHFAVARPMEVFGHAAAVHVVGDWIGHGLAEAVLGVAVDGARVVLALTFDARFGLTVARIADPDDDRDTDEAAEACFGRSVEEIVAALALPVGAALARAADEREGVPLDVAGAEHGMVH